MGAPPDDLLRVIQSNGWSHRHQAGELLVMPSGFFIVVLVPDHFFGVRWGMSADRSDTHRSLSILTNAIQCFSELQKPGTGWTEFKEYLDCD